MLSETETLAYFFLHGTAQFDSTCLEHFFFFSGFLLAKDVGNTWYLVLTWNANTKTCFLKKLSFNVDITILILFYKTFIYLFISFIYFIQIMLTLCIQCWGGGRGVHCLNKTGQRC